MRIHYIMHETFEGLGCIHQWIMQHNHEVTLTRSYLSEPYPPADDIDWLIIMGGGMSTYEEDKHPWLKTEKQFIRRSIDSGKIVLGICLGAQLVADALGAKVYPGTYPEIGWFPVSLNTKNLPRELKHLPQSLTVFHWHGDTFDLPEGAIHLASSEATINQAFIYKEKVLALQFHYEMDEISVKTMLSHAGTHLQKSKYVQTAEEIMAGMHFTAENNRIMYNLLDYLQNS
ncbi:MAG: type 1 glutamine amidotransferase [Bacteroidales bacterium]|nr:type 1 glutamine amidotransferase [Bacteroidales bacterium]